MEFIIADIKPQKITRGDQVHICTQGSSHPIGASRVNGGINFCLYSRSATAVDLLLYNSADDVEPSEVIRLDKRFNKTYHYWHIHVQGLRAGQLYAYRVHGVYNPSRGMRHDPSKALLDPYSHGVAFPAKYDRQRWCEFGVSPGAMMKSVVVDLSAYDWEGDAPLRNSFANTVIYELHVAGFTKNPNSGVAAEKRGTYAGLIEKIPYLIDLGITAVELLPVFQFEPKVDEAGNPNYWGYSPISFFAPHWHYSTEQEPIAAINEFRDMVKAMHRAGIEVILDVVYNHTDEGNAEGPTFCYKGIDNDAYYILDDDMSRYANFSGTGNTLNANFSTVRRMILDSLRFWVTEMHVDGFRFDLASILSRDELGKPIEQPPILWDIESDPYMAGTKLIAEAWDAAGLYQVGSFVGDSWREWNGKFRDHTRRFLKGDSNMLSKFVTRLVGSPDLYSLKNRQPDKSINFVTCHDGFTLNDLVSYNEKHNQDNGEQNSDGTKENHSWNCGIEGPGDDPEIEALRNRQVKNFLTVNVLALGAPMLLMGDEVRRTQLGNNNAYCHDSMLTWFDWSLLQKHGDVHRFLKLLIKTRLKRESSAGRGEMTLGELLKRGLITYHGIKLGAPDWSEESRSIAFTVLSLDGRTAMHYMINVYHEDLCFELPTSHKGHKIAWYRWLDTAADGEDDIRDFGQGPHYRPALYTVANRSIAILKADIVVR
ncbi:MAG: glycogen debranching protein GlgX [Flavobacteriales bacterium]|nr:glycogen debranching protein GlgX [Flavobacteriales bacterium]